MTPNYDLSAKKKGLNFHFIQLPCFKEERNLKVNQSRKTIKDILTFGLVFYLPALIRSFTLKIISRKAAFGSGLWGSGSAGPAGGDRPDVMFD